MKSGLTGTITITFMTLGTISQAFGTSYPITNYPQSTDWNFVQSVQSYQSTVPATVQDFFNKALPSELRKGVGATYAAEVEISTGQKNTLAVELTKILVPVNFQDFSERLPAYEWGLNLAHYLGGDVQVVKRDDFGRPVVQIERMVFSGLPCDADLNLTNQDMTKTEVIKYGPGFATVYWRVYYSNNGSTKVDMGKVDFRAFDKSNTLVTFHSAHKLIAMGKVPLPVMVTRPVLKTFFLDHLRNYRDLLK